MSTEKLVEGHCRFKEAFAADRERYLRLAEEGQHPQQMWIGCSDSRVIPEQITGSEPGELFIVRNVANVVPPFGPRGDAVGAAIEFAVVLLGVSDIVICGHTDCGGIAALEHPADPICGAHLSRWLDLVRPAAAQIDASYPTDEERRVGIVQANVLLQLQNLRTYACVHEAERSGCLSLHAWMYDLRDGELLAFDSGSRSWDPVTVGAWRT
jgi:carbonic anhydrase